MRRVAGVPPMKLPGESSPEEDARREADEQHRAAARPKESYEETSWPLTGRKSSACRKSARLRDSSEPNALFFAGGAGGSGSISVVNQPRQLGGAAMFWVGENTRVVSAQDFPRGAGASTHIQHYQRSATLTALSLTLDEISAHNRAFSTNLARGTSALEVKPSEKPTRLSQNLKVVQRGKLTCLVTTKNGEEPVLPNGSKALRWLGGTWIIDSAYAPKKFTWFEFRVRVYLPLFKLAYRRNLLTL